MNSIVELLTYFWEYITWIGGCTIEIYNIQGQRVLTYNAESIQNNMLEVDASFSAGLYQVIMRGPHSMSCATWVVE